MNNADIEWLGRTFKTSITKPLTDDEYLAAVKYIKTFPDKKAALYELLSVKDGGTSTADITGYYFLDLMYDTRNGQDAWSVNEALGCKKIMEYFNGKCSVNEKVFPPELPLGERFKTAFRLCGIRCCRKVPQFPLKTVNDMLELYTLPGDNVHDCSCGWGMRALGAFTHGVKYFGTDPNGKLVAKINEMKDDYDALTHRIHPADIRPQGSEVFIPEWENTMAFSFSSPPYFGLEIYDSENQSYHPGMEYEAWLESWMIPTFGNIFSYLKPYGVLAINIKDIALDRKTYPLEKDTVDIAGKTGFELKEIRTLKNVKRVYGSRYWEKHMSGVSDKADENIYVFVKKGGPPRPKHGLF